MSINTLRPGDHERLFELLADRATQALPTEEQDELERLLATSGIDEETFDRVCAAVDCALSPQPLEAMPSTLHARIADSARTLFDPANRPAARVATPLSAAPAHRMPWWSVPPIWPAWVAAAAGVLLACFAWWPRLAPQPKLAELRANLLEDARDAVTVAWKPTGDAYAATLEGDVVWSTAQQRGYLRLRNVPGNDPRQQQLQLWIFDQDRDDKFPVDGGVFDVEGAEVIVPISAKLPIHAPKMFAITLEQPGGVVVSAREHVLALAQI